MVKQTQKSPGTNTSKANGKGQLARNGSTQRGKVSGSRRTDTANTNTKDGKHAMSKSASRQSNKKGEAGQAQALERAIAQIDQTFGEGSIMRLARLIQRAAKNGDRMIIKRELESWNHTVGIASIPNHDVNHEPLSSARSV